jgi:SAM-dependent methyltransferase
MVAMNSKQLLETYPRVRPPLSARHAQLYVEEYRRGRSGGRGLPGIVAAVESWMHKQVAGARPGESILELGAGTLNHVDYEPRPTIYDGVEPFRQLWEDSVHRQRFSHIFEDISQIPVDRRYDRIISIAVLEHLTDLPHVLARCGLLLKERGELRAGIPSEGGFLWGLGWRATTGLSFRMRRGLSYLTIMRYEHVNNAAEIVCLLHYFFRRVVIRRFPFSGLHFSLYTSIHASEPHVDRCNKFLSAREFEA